jgi:class 3 adenylate cyclase
MTSSNSNNNEPLAQRNSHENLERLLSSMIEHPEQRAELTQSIEEIFGQEKAIMVLDMSGFSRTTQQYGIVSFLLMIHQMRLIVKPCVAAHRGLLIKAEADNLFSLFDTATDAVRASLEIIQRLEAANVLLPEEQRLYVSIGIGYGQILNVEDKDFYGNEVNLASKLGEDIARMGDVLLTEAAYAALQEPDFETRQENISISGLSLSYFIVQSESNPQL